jgi:hypothetical protein
MQGNEAGDAGAEQVSDLEQYHPIATWFAHNPYGIHGLNHAARVFVWANMIGRQLHATGVSLSIEAIRWAAVLHDVGRLSDGIDAGHGERSAAWVAGHRDRLPMALEDDVIERVLYCCRWHDTRDKEIPVMTPELICIKDADGLDRVRINDLDPNLLRTELAKGSFDQAWDLYRLTTALGDCWEIALKTAEEWGYLQSHLPHSTVLSR